MTDHDPFDCRTPLLATVDETQPLSHYSLTAAEQHGAGAISALPWSLRTLVENLLRHQHHPAVTPQHVLAATGRDTSADIPFLPGRVLLQDASGIPVLADLVTLQERARTDGLPMDRLTPRLPLDLVVDHALEVEESATPTAATRNLEIEFARHDSRYRFLRWAQDRLPGLRVVPPGVGICHQLNLEVLASVVTTQDTEDGPVAALDCLVGTDSHTTMINSLSVTGWGVGGIEATAAALGQPISIRLPRVVGVRLTGGLASGVFASDLALTLAERLRRLDVVGAIVEFFGPGLSALSVPDRATVANMAPEYGATMAWFPADVQTLRYLTATGRSRRHVHRIEQYLRAQGLYHTESVTVPEFDTIIELDLSLVRTTLAGPSRPHQTRTPAEISRVDEPEDPSVRSRAARTERQNGDLAIAAITSCTNTSNPRSLVAAGLLARNAIRAGLRTQAWTKTSFTPGSRAAADLLAAAKLQEPLDQLGFALAGFGCGTCMGNSGPLLPGVAEAARASGTRLAAVLSGNRNFPGRVHPDVTHAYLASPAMVVAYALLGHVRADPETAPLGRRPDGSPVLLADLWPTDEEIDDTVARHESTSLGRSASLPLITSQWQQMRPERTRTYAWEEESGTIRRPPFADPPLTRPAITGDITGARALLVLGDGVTTDHISPVARIAPDSVAGSWLKERGVDDAGLGTFASRRLNHDVMLRGGFANPRLENRLTPGMRGGWTRTNPKAAPVPVHEAAHHYASHDIPTVVVAGETYGAGSARDWAAKVTRLLGVRAVLARSFERIHRTNLVAMGVLPVQWQRAGEADLDGSETFDLLGLDNLTPEAEIRVVVRRGEVVLDHGSAVCRVDTDIEVAWIRAGGLLGHLVAQVPPLVTEQPTPA
ncbi:aconitate hydratase AcnA [Planosporangium thailandense]|uniref:Aconitate hydratase AcnA n=1 Tax=Planosporangium thailandense TaxID=765197 RepID=A0ABX0Y1S9_9ACTN|nr:aconitate hydratase AcnA [Planosporangium thailandense]NJC71394.1 aconitate hydratase AcnA [Planosporangium thailandense]